MLNRKHYKAIAEIIKDQEVVETKNGKMIYKIFLIQDLCKYFKSENINFKRDKFYQACWEKK